ncbi:MAG: hypothetical protein IKL01_07070 [Mailhella sp.]|nr:hypothetical protein [Mailhella sp.]
MPVSRESMLAKLRDAYTVYFDDVDVPADVPHLAACYDFHSTNECFVISKKVKLWSAETNEYVHVFSLSHLDVQTFEACRARALELGMEKVRPHLDHKSSNITAVFVCDSVDPDAAKALEKTRIHKDFLFSLKGWMDFRAAAVELSTGRALVNGAARDMKEFMLGNLARCSSIQEETN